MNLAVLAMRLATLTHASLNLRVVAALFCGTGAHCGRPLLQYRCERVMLLTVQRPARTSLGDLVMAQRSIRLPQARRCWLRSDRLHLR